LGALQEKDLTVVADYRADDELLDAVVVGLNDELFEISRELPEQGGAFHEVHSNSST
jgi:hypothetical protein